MGLAQQVAQLFNSRVNSGAITYAVGLTATPVSGAPGAYSKMLADATPTADWWLVAFALGNLSGAGATAFDYQITRGEAGAGVTFGAFRVLLEAAAAAFQKVVPLAYPPRTIALSGAAARQTTASGKTLDMVLHYVTAVGT